MNYYSFLKKKYAVVTDMDDSDVPVEKCRCKDGPGSCSVHGPMMKGELEKTDDLSDDTGKHIHREDPIAKHALDESERVLAEIGGTVLGNAMVKDFKDNGMASLVGREVSCPADLADLAKVYRNPCFETFRWFVIKDGKVAYQTGVTSRLPCHTAAAIPYRTNASLRNAVQCLGPCDGVYVLHNHPSEDVSPSKDDILLTDQIATHVERQTGLKFLGHVVIDHDKYSTISPEGDVEKNLPMPHPTRSWNEHEKIKSVPGDESREVKIEGRRIKGSSALVTLAKDIEGLVRSGRNDAQIVMVDAENRVTGIATADIRRIMSMDDEEIGSFLRRYAETSNGANCFIVYDLKKNRQYADRMESLIRKTVLLDAVDRNPEKRRTKNFGIAGQRDVQRDQDRYEMGRSKKARRYFEVRANDPSTRQIDLEFDRGVSDVVANPEAYGLTEEKARMLAGAAQSQE